MKIEIYDLTGEYAVDAEEGQTLYEDIHAHLTNGENVELDFKGVNIILTIFLNTAIGQLYQDFSDLDLRQKLEFTNLPDEKRTRIDDVMLNAEHYYNNPSFKETIDQVLSKI